MLRGQLVGLRARQADDVAILHAGLHDDVDTWLSASNSPWRPLAVEASPYAMGARDDGADVFTIVLLNDDSVIGSSVVWGLDPYNRSAHLGVSLFAESRGRGLGSDVVRVLCHYAFSLRGLRRLQIETLAENAAMIGAARRAGFVMEGTLRQAGYVAGRLLDEVVLGQLSEEYVAG